MPAISIPTTASLPHSQRISSTNPAVFRILNKLSRSALLSLVLDWLDDRNQALSAPYLADGEEEDAQDLYPPALSLEDLREIYNELQEVKGSKREIVDRIIEGDWRDGLSLYQLAMADMQYLYDHPASQKWTALKVVQLKTEDESGDEEPSRIRDLPDIPRFHPPTFLQNLQREVLPDVKAHYNLDRPKGIPLLLLRIFIIESPYNTSLALSSGGPRTLDSSKTVYIAFPDASPYIYVSLTTSAPSITPSTVRTTGDTRSLRKVILDGLPKAFSRPRARYALQSTSLSARTLESLIARRGPGRTNAAGGGWSTYATDNKTDNPLNTQLPTPQDESEDELNDESLGMLKGMKRGHDEDEMVRKRRKKIAQSRFGESGKLDDGQGIERFDIRIEDRFPPISYALATLGENLSDENGGGMRERDEAVKKRHKGRRSALDMELELLREKEKQSYDGVGSGGFHDEGSGHWIPDVRITFHGSHIFAGVRQLVERGIVDGEKMPGWMTGEDGVSVGVVKDGRIRGFKGSGI
jgi:central kinetochore subunit Mis15/CHL4